jgi:hypothetical protein
MTTTKYEIGCYADGTFGHQHARDTIADLLEDLLGAHDFAGLPDELRDSTWDTFIEDEAIAILNERTEVSRPAFTSWQFNDGDLGLYPDDPTDVLTVSDTADCEYIRHVNDHGNVTLYRVELVEEWSIV